MKYNIIYYYIILSYLKKLYRINLLKTLKKLNYGHY